MPNESTQAVMSWRRAWRWPFTSGSNCGACVAPRWYATGSSLERLRAAGADAYLTKPLDVDEFLRVVERFLPA